MAYPYPAFPLDAIDGPAPDDTSDPRWVFDAAELNALRGAFNDLLVLLGAGPAGADPDLTTRLATITTSLGTLGAQIALIDDRVATLESGSGAGVESKVDKAGGGNEFVNRVTGVTGGQTIDLGTGNMQVYTFGAGNVTFTLPDTSEAVAKSFTLELRQDATGGRTVTYASTVLWALGGQPAIGSGPNDITVLAFYTPGSGDPWRGYLAGSDLA